MQAKNKKRCHLRFRVDVKVKTTLKGKLATEIAAVNTHNANQTRFSKQLNSARPEATLKTFCLVRLAGFFGHVKR